MSARRALIACLTVMLLRAAPAAAQGPSPLPVLTAAAGYAAFVDDGRMDHGVIGAGAAWVPWRHMSVGPEVLWMIGPGDDRDLFVLGVARFGVVPFGRPVVPFVTAGAGVMRQSNRYGSRTFDSTEGAFVFGGGVRITPTERVYIAPELTVGWEPHVRFSVNVGVALK